MTMELLPSERPHATPYELGALQLKSSWSTAIPPCQRMYLQTRSGPKAHLVLGSDVLANCRRRVATSSEVRARGRDVVACRRALEVDYDAAFCPGGRPCDVVVCVIGAWTSVRARCCKR